MYDLLKILHTQKIVLYSNNHSGTLIFHGKFLFYFINPNESKGYLEI